jgi:hypothetical protein
MSSVLATLQETAQKLPPQKQAELIDFAEFLLSRETPSVQPEPAFDWVDGPDDEPVALTSVELQHLATLWRIEDELDLK